MSGHGALAAEAERSADQLLRVGDVGFVTERKCSA